jgi:hypothetical protein
VQQLEEDAVLVFDVCDSFVSSEGKTVDMQIMHGERQMK